MADQTDPQIFKEINPVKVRYIKLGEGGRWEKECLEDGVVRFGFGSANAQRLPLCREGKDKTIFQKLLGENDFLQGAGVLKIRNSKNSCFRSFHWNKTSPPHRHPLSLHP